MIKRLKNAVSSVLAYPKVSRYKKEARGYGNMAKLIRYGREMEKVPIPKVNWRDPEFRRRMNAISAKQDAMLPQKERSREARRIYSRNVDL